MIPSLVKATVGFEVEWQAGWPDPPPRLPPFEFLRLPRPGDRITILPGDEIPEDHPVVLGHTGYFK